MNRLSLLGALLAGSAAFGCSDDPVSPPPPPPPPPVDAERAALLDTVRLLIDHRNLDPLPAPPTVRSELVELGRALAFDKLLSGNRDISCMTCHLPSQATGDGKSLSVGQGGSGLGPGRTHPDGTFIPRNSPPLFNLHLTEHFFWDGRLEVLEDGSLRTPAGSELTPEMEAVFEFGPLSAQPLFPVLSRAEMRADAGNELAVVPDSDMRGVWAALMDRLGEIPAYVQMFEAAYPGTAFDDMTFAHASNAIAGFFASELAFRDSPFDRFLLGDDDQLTNAELRGAKSFMVVGCMFCHEADAFTDRDGEFQNAATPQIGPGKGDGPGGDDDFGRERVTGDPDDRRKFRPPPLRNVELTAPFGHAGQFATLLSIVEHYDRIDTRLLQYDVSQVEPALHGTMLDNFDEILTTRDTILLRIEFAPGEAEDVVAFLEALTDDAARDLSHLAPASVPSGLSIDR